MDASAESVARVATGGTEAPSSEVTAALRELRRQVAEVLNHGQRLLALNPKHHALRESVMHLQKAQLCLRGGDDEEDAPSLPLAASAGSATTVPWPPVPRSLRKIFCGKDWPDSSL